MIDESFAILGAIIASLGGLYYLYETVLGRTKPNRITWLFWGTLPLIAFASQTAQGAESVSWLTLASGVVPLFVFFASFVNKKSYWKTQKSDYIMALGAVIGVLLWISTKNPNFALIFSLIADILAGMPTMIKSYKHPETESWIAYAISGVGFLIGLLTIQEYTFQNYAFVLYLLTGNVILAVFAIRKPSRDPLLIEP